MELAKKKFEKYVTPQKKEESHVNISYQINVYIIRKGIRSIVSQRFRVQILDIPYSFFYRSHATHCLMAGRAQGSASHQ